MEGYKVFVKVDGAGRVLAINSSAFLRSVDGWVEIDQGQGDRYHHAQGHYLPGAIWNDNGVPRYKLEGGQVVERTAEEIEAETVEPEVVPTTEERLAKVEGLLERLLALVAGIQNN